MFCTAQPKNFWIKAGSPLPLKPMVSKSKVLSFGIDSAFHCCFITAFHCCFQTAFQSTMPPCIFFTLHLFAHSESSMGQMQAQP